MKWFWLLLALLIVAVVSLWVGAGEFTLFPWRDPAGFSYWLTLLWTSRLPRTLAVLFAGSSSAVGGLILQMLLRNRFVEPGMTGTVEGACFGMLVAMIFFPALPVPARLAAAFAGALVATGLFLLLLSRIHLRSIIIVPLTGIILSGVIAAAANFLAFKYDLQQSLSSWMVGDFSMILAGRWELLWLAFGLMIVACLIADRFTLAGLGRDTATSLGLNYYRTLILGVVIIAASSASVVATVGVIPFIGLVVPNLVSLLAGDNLRQSVPLVAVGGALLALSCDVAGRLLNWPYEIPIAVVIGIVGGLGFLALLARERARLG